MTASEPLPLNTFSFSLAIFVLTLGAASGLTAAVRRYALRRNVLDLPNARSSHSVPTPRGGGLSFILLLPLLLGWQVWQFEAPAGVMLVLGGCTLALALVGWLDDHQPLSARLRFGLQALIALCGLLALPALPSLPLFGVELSLAGGLLPVLLVALVWITNLYNFMDGIDGLATLEALSVLLAGSLLLGLAGADEYRLLILLCAPLLGFLYWNLPQARIFMGDVCSAPLGLLLALLAVWLAAETSVNLWCWLILLSAFVVDASWTLLVRLLTGQRWAEPHRSHAYQILARRWSSHGRVGVALLVVNVGWLLPWALLALYLPGWGLLFWLLACSPLVYLCYWARAGCIELS